MHAGVQAELFIKKKTGSGKGYMGKAIISNKSHMNITLKSVWDSEIIHTELYFY